MDKYYSVEQIAKLLALHTKTVQRYIREGKLPARKIGKYWRVSGHALSLFVEGEAERPIHSVSRDLQDIFESANEKIKVSAVVDIPVENSAEAAKIAAWITSAVDLRSFGPGYKSLNTQYIASENIVRILLWDNASFVENILSFLRETK